MVKITHDSHEVTYVYDALNRLIELVDGENRYEYTYDSFNRRLSKVAYLKHSGLWKHQKTDPYLYHEQKEIGSLENNAFTQLRVLGLGKGAEIGAAVAIELNNQFYAPIHDLNGSVACLLDANTGFTAATYRYSAFGEEQYFGEAKNQWRYASKRVDPKSGFVYFGRRYYAPHFGRWITPDPLDFADGPNLCAYLHNNPMTYFDEYGLETATTGTTSLGSPKGLFSPLIIQTFPMDVNTSLELGMGVLNGLAHPLDTVGSWRANAQDSGVSAPTATRLGEAIGVGLLFCPAVPVAVAGKTLVSQGIRMVARGASRLFANKVVRESSDLPLKESPQSIIKVETSLPKQTIPEGMPSLDALSEAAKVLDRAGLTKAGRALDKHGGREGSVFPKATGNEASKNTQGQYHLDDILTYPGTVTEPNKYGGLSYIAPDGRGARFNADGTFRGLLEP